MDYEKQNDVKKRFGEFCSKGFIEVFLRRKPEPEKEFHWLHCIRSHYGVLMYGSGSSDRNPECIIYQKSFLRASREIG